MKRLMALVAMAALSVATVACQADSSRVADGMDRIETKLSDIEDRQIELAARQAELDAAIEQVKQRLDRGDEGLGDLLGLLLMMSWMMPAYSEVYSYGGDVMNPDDLYELMEGFVEGSVIEDFDIAEPEPDPDN